MFNSKPTLSDAIVALGIEGGWKIKEGKIVNWWASEKQPSDSAIDTKLAELISDWESQAYARARKPLYPDIGDQLDDLYHKGAFSAKMAAKIKKVKDDYPKG